MCEVISPYLLGCVSPFFKSSFMNKIVPMIGIILRRMYQLDLLISCNRLMVIAKIGINSRILTIQNRINKAIGAMNLSI